jgi:hypothetical protein
MVIFGMVLGEQICASLRECHECSGFVRFQPAVIDRAFEAGTVFGLRAFVVKQEQPVDLLDVDAALIRLDLGWRSRRCGGRLCPDRRKRAR